MLGEDAEAEHGHAAPSPPLFPGAKIGCVTGREVVTADLPQLFADSPPAFGDAAWRPASNACRGSSDPLAFPTRLRRAF